MPGILAHGALGIWDEVIYLSIAGLFVAFMVISWVRSRNQEPENDATPETPVRKGSKDRFKLD